MHWPAGRPPHLRQSAVRARAPASGQGARIPGPRLSPLRPGLEAHTARVPPSPQLGPKPAGSQLSPQRRPRRMEGQAQGVGRPSGHQPQSQSGHSPSRTGRVAPRRQHNPVPVRFRACAKHYVKTDSVSSQSGASVRG